VNGFDLTYDELVAVVRTCEMIEIPDCTPPYLQEFIAGRLTATAPLLALRVRGYGPEQMEELCAYIQATHRLITRPPPSPLATNGMAG
jgi:hypothetical protein